MSQMPCFPIYSPKLNLLVTHTRQLQGDSLNMRQDSIVYNDSRKSIK